MVFLEILYKTREEVYTEETIRSAWRAAKCWPVDINLARGNITTSTTTTATMTMTTTTTMTTTMTTQSHIFSNDSGDVSVNDANPTLDTPLRLRQLARKFKEQIPLDCDIRKDLLDSFYNFVDIASEKVCEYRDIAPRAHTLNTLRNGKARLKVTGRRRHIPGAARVMTEKEIRSGLEQLFRAEEKNAEKERLTEERKKAAEMKRIVKNAAETQWRLEKLEYEMAKDRWELECGTIKDDWDLAKVAAKSAGEKAPKKPQMPPKPKMPRKKDLMTPIDKPVDDHACESDDSGDEMEAMVESTRELEIEQFASVRIQRLCMQGQHISIY